METVVLSNKDKGVCSTKQRMAVKTQTMTDVPWVSSPPRKPLGPGLPSFESHKTKLESRLGFKIIMFHHNYIT